MNRAPGHVRCSFQVNREVRTLSCLACHAFRMSSIRGGVVGWALETLAEITSKNPTPALALPNHLPQLTS